jgi:preprotein translocase subunit Sss1
MKHIIRSTIQQILADRVMTLLCLGLLLGGIGYIIYVAVNLSASDLQLAIRYTSFGETHFYRDKWWYLLSFVGFGLLFIVAHIGMLAKLYVIGLKQLAYSFAWLSFVVLVLMFVYTYSVLNIAYLN